MKSRYWQNQLLLGTLRENLSLASVLASGGCQQSSALLPPSSQSVLLSAHLCEPSPTLTGTLVIEPRADPKQ